VTYIDPGQNYAKIPVQSIDESNPVFPTKKEFAVVGVNRFDQASRLTYFYRMYSKHCGLSGKFKTTIRALNRTAGDVITLTEDVMGWAQNPVRIYAIRHAANHTHEIYWREYNETIYTDILGSAKPTLNYSTRPNPFAAPPDPTDVTLEESSFILKSGEVITEINVSLHPGIVFIIRIPKS
jgi:hypothetical protein